MFGSLFGRFGQGTGAKRPGRAALRLEALGERAAPSFSFGESLAGTTTADYDLCGGLAGGGVDGGIGDPDLCAGSSGNINSGGELGVGGEADLCDSKPAGSTGDVFGAKPGAGTGDLCGGIGIEPIVGSDAGW